MDKGIHYNLTMQTLYTLLVNLKNQLVTITSMLQVKVLKIKEPLHINN